MVFIITKEAEIFKRAITSQSAEETWFFKLQDAWRRHEDIKMTQRLATTTQAHSDATKKSQWCPEENSTMKRGIRRLEDMEPTPEDNRQSFEEQFRAKKCFQGHEI